MEEECVIPYVYSFGSIFHHEIMIALWHAIVAVYRNNSRHSLPRVKKFILPASDIVGQTCIPFRCLHNIFEYRHWWKIPCDRTFDVILSCYATMDTPA